MLDCRYRFYETEWLMRLMRLLNPIAARWQINLRLTLKLTAKKSAVTANYWHSISVVGLGHSPKSVIINQ